MGAFSRVIEQACGRASGQGMESRTRSFLLPFASFAQDAVM